MEFSGDLGVSEKIERNIITSFSKERQSASIDKET